MNSQIVSLSKYLEFDRFYRKIQQSFGKSGIINYRQDKSGVKGSVFRNRSGYGLLMTNFELGNTQWVYIPLNILTFSTFR